MFGDSHSTPNVCVAPNESFWGLAAQYLQVDHVINCSRPKLSFDSICHMLVCEQENYDFEQDYFLIGIPPLERITVFDDHRDTALISHVYDTNRWDYQEQNITSHQGLINLKYQELDKNSILISDRSWVETQVLRQLFLITTWLDNCHANYLIVNFSKDLDANNIWGPSKFVLEYCRNHDRMQCFSQSLYNVNLYINKTADHDQYGWFGHHGPAGNRHFFEKSIKNKLC